MKWKIVIENETNPLPIEKKYCGKIFGPFSSVGQAIKTLDTKGWVGPKMTGIKGHWHALIERYISLGANIKKMSRLENPRNFKKPEKLPIGYAAFLEF